MVGELVAVHLNTPHVSVGLLHPPLIAQDERVSVMADAQDTGERLVANGIGIFGHKS